MRFQDFANSLSSELQLTNKPLPRQKPIAETFSDTPLPAWLFSLLFANQHTEVFSTKIPSTNYKNRFLFLTEK